MYGMGVAVGDYDNDGRDDVYITALEGDRLFHNEGNGKFRDVTEAAGISNANFGTSAAWLDYDRDGKLDLFVANYVQWTPTGDLWCSLDGATKSYCTPESYKGTRVEAVPQPGRRQVRGRRRRRPASAIPPASRSASPCSTTTATAGPTSSWPTTPSPTSSIATSGTARSRKKAWRPASPSAKTAWRAARWAPTPADYDRSGRPHLLVGNFSNQMLGLYHNEGNGLFVDEAPRRRSAAPSLLTLTFGVFFFDYDLDG